MKVEAFAGFFRSYQEYLEVQHLSSQTSACEHLRQALMKVPGKSVAEACKIVLKSGRSDEECGEFDQFKTGLSAFQRMLRPFASKSLISDIELLLTALEGRSLAKVANALADAAAPKKQTSKASQPDSEVVQRYVQALETTLRDEAAFKLAFAGLKADKNVKLPALKAIARAFAGEQPKNTQQAYQQIWNHHSSLIESRAKEASRDGRSAA